MNFEDYNSGLNVSLAAFSHSKQGFPPMLPSNEDDDTEANDLPDEVAILPIKNTVLFTGVIMPIAVNRKKSVNLLKRVYRAGKIIGVVTQSNQNSKEPKKEDLYKVGTLARVIKILEMPDNTTSVIIRGVKRFKIDEILSEKPYLRAKITKLVDIMPQDADHEEFEALMTTLKGIAIQIIELSPNIPDEAVFAVKNIESTNFLLNFISSNSNISATEKQKLLEIDNLKERAVLLLEYLSAELQKLEIQYDIRSKVKKELDQQQKEYFLNEQIKAIQNELGNNDVDVEIKELQKKAKTKKWNKEVAEVFDKTIKKLEHINPAAPEYGIEINYLQVLLELPWNEYTKDNFDLKRAQKILDKEHFGLDEVKDRIIEHLAVLKLKNSLKAPILCLVGPPGVGKTSLGRSIAKAINRKYVRISLGGLHDESEIRGHRKTYIGAMPGRIIKSIKKVKSSNPVFILDEIDKVGNDFRGDPSSALLEVLDPEQNKTFYDNFLETEYDLSNVMFIATANTLSTINPALVDRMEVIYISGYLVEEKIEIAKRHIIPKQLKEHGLQKNQLTLNKTIIEKIIDEYTRESGVRQLDKITAKLMRKIARKIALEEEYNPRLGKDDITELLGQARRLKNKYQGNDYAGVVTGLAWTSVGGEIMLIETSISRGSGRLTTTGNLGHVMKESVTIALEYVRAHSEDLKIDRSVFDNWNIHLHVPEGAIRKDGPSAGITMATSIASILTQRKVRSQLAMTGEITLRGKVLPVGGIKEKILAAKRANIKEIILSKENERDIKEIKEIYLKGLKFHYVSDVSEVFAIALLKQKVNNPRKLEIEKSE